VSPAVNEIDILAESEVRIFLTAPMLSTEPVAKSFDPDLKADKTK